MRVFREGIEIADAAKTISDTNNYGFVRKTWQTGKYTVLYKQTIWHDDDVRDFTFRIFMPYKVDIKLTELKSENEYT